MEQEIRIGSSEKVFFQPKKDSYMQPTAVFRGRWKG